MSMTNQGNFLLSNIRSTGPTSAAQSNSLLSMSQESAERWNVLIDHTLIEWANNPASLEEVDFRPPTREAIRAACEFAADRQRHGDAYFVTRAVPDGDGGIIFDGRDGTSEFSIQFSPIGEAEFVLVKDHRVLHRQCL
jgi:hypothetical protein